MPRTKATTVPYKSPAGKTKPGKKQDGRPSKGATGGQGGPAASGDMTFHSAVEGSAAVHRLRRAPTRCLLVRYDNKDLPAAADRALKSVSKSSGLWMVPSS